MLKINKIRVSGWEPALRGMRNPKNSWDRSDTTYNVELLDDGDGYLYPAESAIIGPNDHKLAMTLVNAGPEHRKFLRMIHCYANITAPLYWWKEFDTYKIGTTANSCSTMHKIMDKPFEFDDFSHEHLADMSLATNLMPECIGCDIVTDVSPYRDDSVLYSPKGILKVTINALNQYRNAYLCVKDRPTKDLAKKNETLKKIWWQVIQLLPSSYNQMRTVDTSYEVLANIARQRAGHKQDEWRETFVQEFIPQLPYSEFITGKEK
nr:MAG TPA: hypothetical protein [Caudoviricetes sp.]